ncbi:MAG: radical SAM protein [Litorimonas sp.]
MLTSPFTDPTYTTKGERRAVVPYRGTQTLWFNTGTLCNIECINCYIESSPTNDRLVYLGVADVEPYLDELDAAEERGIEIGFTGGEPFLAPEMIDILRLALSRGHRVLLLTNAMRPMMRPRVQTGLLELKTQFGDRLRLRVSLDHYSQPLHDEERGSGAFDKAMTGLRWLTDHGFTTDIAGRTVWGETDEWSRAGYASMISDNALDIDPNDPARLVLFPEMRGGDAPPEISVGCWDILGKRPDALMCASQRMVVKRKGAARASVVACTLLPYDARFELGNTLEDARQAVTLNHPWCATFCVLGGGNCSG